MTTSDPPSISSVSLSSSSAAPLMSASPWRGSTTARRSVDAFALVDAKLLGQRSANVIVHDVPGRYPCHNARKPAP